jgi:hypothetical protein
MDSFKSFNISFIPKEKNQKVNALTIIASLFKIEELQQEDTYHVKIIFQSSVLDNQEHLQIFENDEHVVNFFTDDDTIIEEDSEESQNLQEEIQEQSIKPSLKKYVNLESLFMRDDQIKISKPLEDPSVRKFQEKYKISISTPKSPKYINLGTNCTKEERDKYTQLFKEFQDVFTWSYNNLKEYDKSIFQHIIPMKEGAHPLKQKLRIINPKKKPW